MNRRMRDDAEFRESISGLEGVVAESARLMDDASGGKAEQLRMAAISFVLANLICMLWV